MGKDSRGCQTLRRQDGRCKFCSDPLPSSLDASFPILPLHRPNPADLPIPSSLAQLTYQNDETLFLTADEVEQNEKEAKRAPKRSKKNGAVTPTPVYPTQPRSITGGTLKDYQIEGVRWLIAQFGNSKGALLADEMVS